MTVSVYYSTDSGAPSLYGTAGRLIAVLDACLVTGYGSKAGAGWAKEYSGTNLAAYRQGTGGNGHYLYVDDSGSTNAKFIGYESMSSIGDTSGAAFPTAAQFAGGLYALKSDTADTTSRPWVVIATSKAFYVYVGDGDTLLSGAGASPRNLIFFGNFTSLKSGDAYNTALIASTSADFSGAHMGRVEMANTPSAQYGHYCARSHTQTGSAVTLYKRSDSACCDGTYVYSIGRSGESYPDPVTGGMLLAPVFLCETSIKGRRGKLPGFWAPLHNTPGTCGDTFAGSGSLAGKTFILLNAANTNSYGARVAIEISDTW